MLFTYLNFSAKGALPLPLTPCNGVRQQDDSAPVSITAALPPPSSVVGPIVPPPPTKVRIKLLF